MNNKLKKLDLFFVLFILVFFILFSFIFLSKDFDSFNNFILFGALIIVLFVAYFEKLIWGLLSSIFIIFLYSSYEIYYSFSLSTQLPLTVYMWIILIPFLAYITGKISESINEIADENFDLINKYKELVTIDHRTGLKNIKAFYLDLEREISRTIRHNTNLSLMVIKLPFLNQIKSILSQNEFNELLDSISRALEDSTRLEDSIYNLEDHTLAILMIETDIKGAEVVKNRIKDKISKENLKLKSSGKNVVIDLQIGIVQYSKNIKNAFEFKEKAEEETIYDL